MSFHVTWTPEDFAVGYGRLSLLEEYLISSALETAPPLQPFAEQLAQMIRITTLVVDNIFLYNPRKNTPYMIANLLAGALTPYGIAVKFNGIPIPIQTEIADIDRHVAPDRPKQFSSNVQLITEMLPVPLDLAQMWGEKHVRLVTSTLYSFQEVFACVASRSSDSNVSEAARRVELVLRSTIAIARNTQDGTDVRADSDYIANKLRNGLGEYNIGIGNWS